MALKAVSRLRSARWRLLSAKLIYRSCSDIPASAGTGSSSEFDTAIRSLKNNLQPERLTRVIDSTPDSSLALRIFRWASHQRYSLRTVDTYRCMISKLTAVENRDDMDSLLGEMVRLKAPALEQALNGFAGIQHATSAKLKLSLSACNAMLRGLVKQGSGLRLFMLVYMEIVKSGVLPDVETLNWLIQALCESGRVDLALIQFDRMSKKRCSPNSHTFEILIIALCSHNRADEAVDLFYKMLQLRCTLLDSVRYLEKLHNSGLVDCESWNIVITHFCNQGNIRRASELIGRMVVSSFAPDESTYSAIISCYCRLGLHIDALGMFRRVSVNDLSLNSESFSQLVEVLCHTERNPEAIEVFKYHCKRGCSLTNKSLDMLIQGSCLSGRIREAVQLRSLAVCTGTSCTFFTYDIIIQALLHLNKEKDVLVLFAQMVMEGCLLDGCAYTSLLRSFLTKETIFEAAILFNRMVNQAFFPDQETFELLVNDMALFSFLNLVAQSLLKVVNTRGTVSPRIYNIIIYGLIKEGFKNEACKFLDQMLEKGWVPDSRTHQVLVGNIGGEEAREVDQLYQTVDDDNVSNILLEELD
ncbi:pentatricopeptide repeat-containing protein [Panicum miliaceum]|uniref:Pentatricopeptide repeat-containing protein n=1 Tax=Panicum miliaceum TaxID=4540 RepID=A0A3L6S8P8_PANMI|nr:pentatricopeptide repeat-containing protein [Panicum miliaceum]